MCVLRHKSTVSTNVEGFTVLQFYIQLMDLACFENTRVLVFMCGERERWKDLLQTGKQIML